MTAEYTPQEEGWLRQKGALGQPVYAMCSDGNYRTLDDKAEFDKMREKIRREYYGGEK